MTIGRQDQLGLFTGSIDGGQAFQSESNGVEPPLLHAYPPSITRDISISGEVKTPPAKRLRLLKLAKGKSVYFDGIGERTTMPK